MPRLRSVRRRSRRSPRSVLIVVQNLPVPLDRRVWLECQALVSAGFTVSVICPKGPGDPSYELLDGVHLYKYRPPPAAKGALGFVYEFAYCFTRTAWRSIGVQRRHRVGVIQACNPPDTYWLLARLSRPLGCEFVYDQHDLCPEIYESRFEQPNRRLSQMLRWLERATYRSADRVISTNESYRSIAIARGRCRPEQVSVVRSGPDARKMQRSTVHPELKAGREHLLCWLGIMGPQDGVDLALRSFAVLVHELGREDVHLALLGFGDCLTDLQRLAVELRIDDRVTFTGRADNQIIVDYFSTASVGLGPDPKNALNDHSTMNKILEYMACELPIVSFDLHESQVSAGDAAVFVPSGDVAAFARAIDALLDDEPRRSRMGRIGRDRIETRLAWNHQADVYVSVYEDLARARVDQTVRIGELGTTTR